MATYTYSISMDFPNHAVAPDRLTEEIQVSAIVTALNNVGTVGDNCNITFNASLSMGDQTILNGIVAAHNGTPLASPDVLIVGPEAVGDAPTKNPVLVAVIGEDGKVRRMFGDGFGVPFARCTGNVNVGAAPTQPPVLVGGLDPSGNVKTLEVGGVGTHANVWNNVATGAGGNGNAIDLGAYSTITAFGHVSGATLIVVQISQNGVNYYNTTLTYNAGGADDFYITGVVTAKYARLYSSNNVTATGTIAAKVS